MAKMRKGDTTLYGWEAEFEDWIKNRIDDRDISALIKYDQYKFGKLAAPTPDHYVPVIYSMALADSKDEIRYTYTELLPGFSNRSFIVESLN